MSKAKKIAIICDDSGNISGTNLSGTNTGDQVIPVASSTIPANLGTAAIGTGITFARADHVHEIPILSTLTFGAGLSGTSYNTSSAVTIAIDSTVTTLTGSQTLTNKTLTSPAVTTSLTTGSTTFNLLNTTATTINFGSAATAITIGDTSHTGITSIQHDLYVYGNITFGGGSTQLSATQLVIDDPLIYIGDNNTADIIDLGIIGAYNNGTHLHTGLVRDASDSVWKLFSGMTSEPSSSTVDFTGVTYAPLKVGNLEYTGTLTGSTGILNIGSGQVYKDASGNVGIGTSSPSVKLDVVGAQYIRYGNYDALTINGSSTNSVGLRIQNTVASGRNWNIAVSGGGVGAAGTFLIYDDTAGANRLAIDSSGNVGIGTSSPSSFGKFAVVGSNTGGAIVNYFSNSWTTATANTQVVLSLDPGGNGYGVRDCQIRAINNGGNQNSLTFYTSNAATPVEALRIDYSGNVGIGKSSPSTYSDSQGTVLAVGNAVNIATIQPRSDGPSGAGNGVSYGVSYTTNPINGARIWLGSAGSSGQQGIISFNTKGLDDNTTQPLERLRITSAGGISFGSSGTAYGTAAQVLLSSGNAPPVWQNQSSIAAGTATTATNQSGGTVSATTGAFSGTTSFPSATGAFNIQNGTGDGASFTVYNTAIHSHWGIGFRDYQDLTTVKAYIDCRSGNIGTSGAFVGNVTGNVTGSSASCTGNAATATTATNQSGGTVSATTGAFSGVVSMSNNIQYTANSTYGINFNGASTDMHRIYLDGYWTIFKSHANEGWKFRDNSNVDRVTITGAAGNITTSGSLNANGNIIINNGSPTIYFQDTDQQCAMLHNNSNLFYILRGGINTLTWSTVGSGNWPMTLNLTNNDVTWGGNISAIYNITAYASDKRLKENIVEIPNAIEKIKKIRGVTFDWNDISETHGFIPQQKYNDVGVIAQEIEEVLPQVVTLAPFDTWIADPDTNYTPEELEEKSGKSKSGENYKTVQYDRIVPLLIQAIKEQQAQIDELKELINKGK